MKSMGKHKMKNTAVGSKNSAAVFLRFLRNNLCFAVTSLISGRR